MTADTGPAERELAARIIDTLLREDYAGLSSRLRPGPDEPVLELPVGDGTALRLPLEQDGFLADFRVRRPPAGSAGTAGRGHWLSLDDVHAAIAAVSDPLDRAGVTAFADESRHALAALRLRGRHLPDVRARLARLWQAVPQAPGPQAPAPQPPVEPVATGREDPLADPLAGPRGLLAYEALAATMPHPPRERQSETRVQSDLRLKQRAFTHAPVPAPPASPRTTPRSAESRR